MSAPGAVVTVARDELERLVNGAHHDPHSMLGAHPTGRRPHRDPHAASRGEQTSR